MYGCKANGVKPFSKETTASTTSTTSTTKIPSTRTLKLLTSTTFTVTTQKLVTVNTKHTSSAKSEKTVKPFDSIKRVIKKSYINKNNQLSYLWILFGILAGCVAMICLLILVSHLWRRLIVGSNKISASDVVIHKPNDHKKSTVFVIT